jgi:hypothetical protein
MVTIIDDPYSGNAFGRIGKGIGKGLSDQLPKEVERGRLSAGLKKLEKESEGLDPMQYFSRAITIPGITPQMVESLGQLVQRRMQAKALQDFNSGEGKEGRGADAFPKSMLPGGGQGGEGEEAPSITTRPPIQATIEPFIPRTPEEKAAAAAKNYEANKGFFKHDPQAALAYEDQKDATEIARNQALQSQRKGEQDVQNLIQNSLNAQHGKLGGKVPSEVYSRIEDKAIKAVKSKEMGGEGLTEQQAIKKYGDELNDISKEYNQIFSLTKFNQLTKGAKETTRVLKDIQKKLSTRDEEEIFAKILQTENGLSPDVAYKLAYPVSNTPEVDKYLKGLPAQPPFGPVVPKNKRVSQEQAFQEIFDRMGKKSGPLAISDALRDKGYDADAFLKFLDQNKNKLTGDQARQLTEARNALPTLNDLFLHTMLE